MSESDDLRGRWMRRRIGVLCLLLLGFAGVVLRKGAALHFGGGDRFRREAERQYVQRVRLDPRRGSIRDRNGQSLAVSVDTFHVWTNPAALRANGVSFAEVARRVAAITGGDEARMRARLESSAERFYARLALQVPREVGERVRAAHIPFVSTEPSPRRYYPNRALAAQVLGFVDVDGNGREGVELTFDERLRGRAGFAEAVTDARRRVVYSDRFFDDSGEQGDDLVLTIDEGIQRIVERELELAAMTYEARAASAVVLDPRTGEILALASYPIFNPNTPGRADQEHHRNHVTQDRFEPGSTVKPFVIAAALDVGSVRADQPIDVEGGILEVEGGKEIRDSHPTDFLTVSGILSQSSNIGAAKVGLSLGRPGLYRALRRFGFGESTEVGLPGESRGSLPHYRRWYERDAMSISFGQGMSCSTLQLAVAMAALANEGRMMRPHILRSILDPDGRPVETFHPETVRQVVRADTARLVADMLVGVTGPTGTAPEAAIPGYLTAGKTGTAQKANQFGTGYDQNRFVASFVGFAPAQRPRVVIAVVLDEPAIDHVAGQVAAPVFRRIGAAALRHLGVPAEGGGQALADHARLEQERVRERRRIERDAARRTPRPARRVAADTPADDTVLVPDLLGRTLRGVVVATAELDLALQLEGTGVVVEQTPPAESRVAAGTPLHVVLAPPAVEAPLPATLPVSSPTRLATREVRP